jgi:hypothetical protein
VPRIPATHVGTGPDGAEIFRPIIIVAIEIGSMRIRVPALVDSGADNTLVPFEFVEPLGIVFDDLPAGHGGSGPGGPLDTRPCNARMIWEKEKALLMETFIVAEPKKGPDAVLLGRADFFKAYIPRFHWHKDPPVFDLDPVIRGKA